MNIFNYCPSAVFGSLVNDFVCYLIILLCTHSNFLYCLVILLGKLSYRRGYIKAGSCVYKNCFFRLYKGLDLLLEILNIIILVKAQCCITIAHIEINFVSLIYKELENETNKNMFICLFLLALRHIELANKLFTFYFL